MQDLSPEAFSAAPASAAALDACLAQIAAVLPPEAVITDPLRTLVYGTDASLYRLIPRAVLRPRHEADVSVILAAARAHGAGVTFRAAGTSLSGQAITDQLLVQIGPAWGGAKVEDGGARVSVGPAMIGAQVNAILAPLGRRIGPDPASLDSAHVGGIAANNASGMCCGTAQNSYRTLAAMRVMLADGGVLDTADPASRAAFAKSHAALLSGLAALRAGVLADDALAARIRRKFAIKNTCGYSLNALVDYDDPIDILQHLMIGSEGTLCFIARITYHTVADPHFKAAALALFPDIRAACEATIALKTQPVDAVELMDRLSLRAVENQPGMPGNLAALPEGAAALLIETRAADAGALAARVAAVGATLADMRMVEPAAFTEDPQAIKQYWAVRKGAFPSVGAMRATGTAVIIEDVAVPIERLADATLELRALFSRHGYDDAIVFGHALEGNLHFVLTPDFAKAGAIEAYAAFMDDLAKLIVEDHDGSLKAEHGTGRNMAPFVEMEWGAQAYALMRRLKALFDPLGVLNPGVILNDDPQVHIRDIKAIPAADPHVDPCIECGFCEPVCPSRNYTLTPRQRIVGLRAIEALRRSGDNPERLRALESAYQHQAIDSCAIDSLCAKACPVGVDTGRMMKTLRARRWGKTGPRVAAWVGRNFAAVTWATRQGLGATDLLHRLIGTRAMSALTGGARKLSGGRIPLWTPAMPGAGAVAQPPAPSGDRPRVVYFPSCASRAMGPARGDAERDPLSAKVISLLGKAGYDVVYPPQLGQLCCGQPFESKGLMDEADRKGAELEAMLWRASREGRDPVVFDTSPCAFRALKGRKAEMTLYDLPDFLHDHVLPKLSVTKKAGTVALHPTCSTLKRGAQDKLAALAAVCAERTFRPAAINCCGWSGDRGFTLPALNASALATLKDSLPEECVEGVSSSRTCEIGLSHHGGRPYRSIAYLLDRCAEPAPRP